MAEKLNNRLRFEQLPDEIVAFAESILGSRVAVAESQAGGFSPGTADRLLGEDGSRLFMKAVSRRLNAGSFRLFQAEAGVWNAVGGMCLPAPRFRGHTEFGDWVALAFDDIPGHEPEPDDTDLAAVMSALRQLPVAPEDLDLPAGMHRTVPGLVASWATGWDDSVALGALATLPPYATAHSSTIGELARGGVDASAGGRLQHVDLHADNVIIDRGGAAWLVDWPWAAVGAPWFDTLGYLASQLPGAPIEAVQRWAAHPQSPLVHAPADDVDAVLAALIGNRLRASLLPPPPALTGLREGQRAFALSALSWLAHRRGWA